MRVVLAATVVLALAAPLALVASLDGWSGGEIATGAPLAPDDAASD